MVAGPASPSGIAAGSLILILEESSFVKLLVPIALVRVAFILGLLKVTCMVSSPSTRVSPLVVTVISCVSVSVAAANVKVPESVSSFPPLIK